MTARSDATRKDVINDTLPELDPDEGADEATNNKDKLRKGEKSKEKEAQKTKPVKQKTERQSRSKQQSNLQIDQVVNMRSRSKSSTRRSKSPSGREEMEWDGKKWKVKPKKEDEHSDRSHKSDKSEISFMDSKHQDMLLDKLMG